MQIGMWKTIAVTKLKYIAHVGVQIRENRQHLSLFLGVFWTFDCGMLSTQQNNVSTVPKIAIVATGCRQQL